MQSGSVLVEHDSGVLVVTLNRPETGNAMPPEAASELTELFRAVNGDANIRSVLLRGAGRNFCAGGDVRVFAKSLGEGEAMRRADWMARQERLIDLVLAYVDIDVPVVASCQGGVAGAGLMYALGADTVIGDESTVFAFSHQRIGLPPDAGVSLLLPRRVGEVVATNLVLRARRCAGEDAARLGLIDRFEEAAQRDVVALAEARELAAAPTQVVRRAKHLMRRRRITREDLLLEAEAIVASVAEPAFEEGVNAFLEKRPPQFGLL